MEVGRLSPFVISLQIFLLMTSTSPPFSVTSLYNMYRSRTCLAMMGMRLTGVPAKERENQTINHLRYYILNTWRLALKALMSSFQCSCRHMWTLNLGYPNKKVTMPPIYHVCFPAEAHRHPVTAARAGPVQDVFGVVHQFVHRSTQRPASFCHLSPC